MVQYKVQYKVKNGICYFLEPINEKIQTFAEMSQNIICEGTVSYLFWLSVDWLKTFLNTRCRHSEISMEVGS